MEEKLQKILEEYCDWTPKKIEGLKKELLNLFFVMARCDFQIEEALKQEQERGQTLPLAVVGSSFFIEDLRSKLKVAKMEMDNANNPTSAIKATGNMLAYKDVLDGIKNGYYK